MPRISRHSVRFSIDGTEYLASFGHKHFEPPRRVEGLKLRHETICWITERIGFNGSKEAVRIKGVGKAACSSKDAYDWRRGIKLAFERALLKAGMEEGSPGWGAFHREFFNEMRVRN